MASRRAATRHHLVAGVAAIALMTNCSVGTRPGGPLADTSSYHSQSEANVASCTPIEPDAKTFMLVTALHLSPDFDVPRDLTFTGVQAHISPEVIDVRPVLVLGDTSYPGYSAVADQTGDVGAEYSTVPMPADYDGTQRAGVGVIVEIRADGPLDPEQPVVDIAGIEYTVEGRGDFVIPASRTQWVSRLNQEADEFCAAYDLASLP